MTSAADPVELPSDVTSAALARRHLRAFCADAGLEHLLDDGLLLLTELVTNAVVHAGTSLTLEAAAVDGGLRVQVTDGRPGPVLAASGPVDDDREGGRGLFLLDTLATTWGSSHSRSGKALWFFLGPEQATARPPAATSPPATRPLTLSDLGWLLAVADRTPTLGAQQVVEELMHRLVEGLPAAWAAVLGPGGPEGWQVQRQVGAVPADLTPERVRRLASTAARSLAQDGDLVLPLGLAGTVTGAVVLGGAAGLDADRLALARLAADEMAVLLQDELSRDLQRRDRGALTLLAEASEMFAGALDVSLAAMLLCQLTVPRFGAWAAVYSRTGGAARLLASTHEDEQRGAELQVHLSSSAVRDLAAVQPSGSAGAHLLDASSLPQGLESLGTTVLAVPLMARRRALGLLLLGRGDRGPAGEDIPLLVDLSRRAALAIEGARLYEERSEVARVLQASLLPPALPEVSGLQFGARYAAAGEGNEVGGDFYDVFPGPDGSWAVAIGDVCGKGPEAATITGLARHVLRLMVEEGRTAEQALRRLNTAILDLGDRGRFLTAALVLLTPHERGVRAVVAVSGHPPPAVVLPSGEVRFVAAGGTLLGVTPDIDIGIEELELAVGDHLVLYTDGVTERRDGSRWFGDATLQQELRDTCGWPADLVAGRLEQRVVGFADSAASDDLAVLVVGASLPRAQEGPGSAAGLTGDREPSRP